MKLSEQELRWLSRWEKRERQWTTTRWVVLASGILSVVLALFMADKLRDLDLPNVEWLWFVPFYFLLMAGIKFGIVFSKWSGDIKLRLLLRLIREHEKPDA
jgi:hypothetical protein